MLLAGWLASVPGAAQAAPVRLIAIGDSITHGDGSSDGTGFRDDLYHLLDDAGIDVLMVGSMGETPYRGHYSGGKRIRQFYPREYGNHWGTGTVDVTGDIAVLTPRVALIHLGTNDINSYHTPFTPYSDDGGRTLVASAAGRMAELVSYLLQWSDGTRGDHLESIVLSRLVPINYRDDDVRAFNAEIDKMIEDLVEGTVTGRPERVLVADHYRRFDGNRDLFTFGPRDWMDDDLHPNDAGYAQIAALYAEKVREALRDFDPPSRPVLAVGDRGGRAVTLEWRAPGDDGDQRRAARYDLRFATEPIDEHSFARATKILSEPDPANPGQAQTLRVGALRRDRTYYFALRAIDDAANRSQLGYLTVRTTDDDGYFVDDFARLSIGESWSRSVAIEMNEHGVHAPAGDPQLAHLMVYTPESVVGSAEITLGEHGLPSDVGKVGVVLRLDRANSASRGYAVVRDGRTGGQCRLYELRDGRVLEEIDAADGTLPAPGPGDRLGVWTDEAGGAFLFKVYVNGQLDAELRDPERRIRTSKRYGGFILAGGAQISVDRINLLRPGARSRPEPASLESPPNGFATGQRPELRWQPAVDPNLGQTVRYAVRLSHSPSMADADSITGLETTSLVLEDDLSPLTTYYWQVRSYDTSGRGSLSVVQSFVALEGSTGVADADPTSSAPVAYLRAAPNPFNPSTLLSFRLERAGDARLSIYDVRGRLVRRLWQGRREAGEMSVRWDGSDDSGRRCASGVYFVRLESAGPVLDRKLVLAR
jgi:lysophospholipase L1-like esterase